MTVQKWLDLAKIVVNFDRSFLQYQCEAAGFHQPARLLMHGWTVLIASARVRGVKRMQSANFQRWKVLEEPKIMLWSEALYQPAAFIRRSANRSIPRQASAAG
jgi:hypothetical protein